MDSSIIALKIHKEMLISIMWLLIFSQCILDVIKQINNKGYIVCHNWFVKTLLNYVFKWALHQHECQLIKVPLTFNRYLMWCHMNPSLKNIYTGCKRNTPSIRWEKGQRAHYSNLQVFASTRRDSKRAQRNPERRKTWPGNNKTR